MDQENFEEFINDDFLPLVIYQRDKSCPVEIMIYTTLPQVVYLQCEEPRVEELIIDHLYRFTFINRSCLLELIIILLSSLLVLL